MVKKKVFLTQREIDKTIKKHEGWKVNAKRTQFFKVFNFENHIPALVFVARISVHSGVLKHYPDIELSNNKVKILITTHKLKALTKVDLSLLERIDNLEIN